MKESKGYTDPNTNGTQESIERVSKGAGSGLAEGNDSGSGSGIGGNANAPASAP